MSRRLPASPLPCAKVASLQDVEALADQLRTLERYPDALAGQHDIRRWEYAMALYAINTWTVQTLDALDDPLRICDIGGAGSNFWQVLTSVTSADIHIIDPVVTKVPGPPGGQVTLSPVSVEEYAAGSYHDQFDIITCISVIEHVKEVRPFLRACRMLLKPGGLLFLTTDYWDAEGPDTAHFHWMRERIYNADLMRKLLADCRELGYSSFGPADWKYHGPQVYDYSVVSAALVKRWPNGKGGER